MENQIFSNTNVLAWLQYFSENTELDLEHVKILDITKKNKNLIPAVEAHRSVLVFTEAGDQNVFYRMYNAGLGDCTVIYNEGSEPVGPVKKHSVASMMDRGINASAGMLVLNPNARTTVKFGMDNRNFATGSVRFVGSEIRTILLSKMQLTEGKNICVISGESIAIEAAIQDGDGTVVAVEYSKSDRQTLEQNVNQFGLNNVIIVDHVDAENFKDLPVPEVTMLVASASMEQEMKFLLELNPKMEFVIYTLDFVVAASMPKLFKEFGLGDPEIIQMTISKLTSKNTYRTEPAPWIISGKAE